MRRLERQSAARVEGPSAAEGRDVQKKSVWVRARILCQALVLVADDALAQASPFPAGAGAFQGSFLHRVGRLAYASRPPTPPYVRFRIRRFNEHAEVADGFPPARPAPCV